MFIMHFWPPFIYSISVHSWVEMEQDKKKSVCVACVFYPNVSNASGKEHFEIEKN